MMITRRFGRTNLQLSPLTLGTMRLLHGWDLPHEHLPDDSLQSTYEILTTILNNGINLIETARGYGKSERLLGQVLPQLKQPRHTYLLMSKAPPASTSGEMRRWLEESLQRLNVDYLDLFAYHGLNSDAQLKQAIAPHGPFAALLQAREEGLIHHIGFSSHAPLPVLLRIIATNLFDFVNLHYYRFRTTNRAAVLLAAALDMGVFIISPNDKGGRLYEPTAKLSQLTHPLHPIQFNERWLLSQPQIHTLSIGLSAAEQLPIHLEGLKATPLWGLPEHQAAQRLADIETKSRLYGCGTDCFACEPCPQGINIPELLRLLHLIHCFDMNLFAKYRYDLMQPGDPWVPGAKISACDRCDLCLPRCPQGLPISDLILKSCQRLAHQGT